MKRYFLMVLLVISSTASAVVIRSDVDDAKYRIPASSFSALADMHDEGHGVLIAPQWVVTAAHAAPMQGMHEDVTIRGVAYRIDRVVTFPGYKRLPDALVKEALASGDPSKIHAYLASADDIALIKLASPVKGIVPTSLYRGKDEIDKTIELIGRGATGNGIDGEVLNGSHRGILRQASNVVIGADERYLWYRFDPPSSGLPLEGTLGSGDSGGPVIIENNGQKQLAGLNSWIKAAPGNGLRAGLYGQLTFAVRISGYIKWIENVISAPASTHAMSSPEAAISSFKRTREKLGAA